MTTTFHSDDTDVGGSNDGDAAVRTDGIFNYFEFSHPLCSGDINDFCVSGGDIIGFKVSYFVSEEKRGTGILDDWPSLLLLDTSNWGDIRIASPWSPPSTESSPSSTPPKLTPSEHPIIRSEFKYIPLPGSYSQNDFREAQKTYNLLLATMLESQYATQKRSVSSPLFIRQEKILNEYANKWSGYTDVANQLLYDTLIPDPKDVILDILTGGLYGAAQDVITLKKTLDTLHSMNNDLETLQKELYSQSDSSIQAIYDRVSEGYSLPIVETTSDAILFFKLAGKYSGISQSEVNNQVNYFEDFLKKTEPKIAPFNEKYFKIVGKFDHSEKEHYLNSGIVYIHNGKIRDCLKIYDLRGPLRLLGHFGGVFSVEYEEGPYMTGFRWGDTTGTIYVLKGGDKGELYPYSTYMVTYIKDNRFQSVICINEQTDGLEVITGKEIQDYVGKYGLNVPDKYRITRLLLSDSETAELQKMKDLPKIYSRKVLMLESDVKQILKVARAFEHPLINEINQIQSRLNNLKSLLNYYDSSYVIVNNYVIMPERFKNYIDSFSDVKSLSSHVEKEITEVEEFMKKAQTILLSSMYLEYSYKRLFSYYDISEGLNKGTDASALFEFAKESQNLGDRVSEAGGQFKTFNSNKLQSQADFVRVVITAFDKLRDTQFYMELDTKGFYSKYLKPIVADVEQLILLIEWELQILEAAKINGIVDKELSKVLDSEIVLLNKVKQNASQNFTALLNELRSSNPVPISQEYSVKKGDIITKEILVSQAADYITVRIEQIKPSIAWYESEPMYTVEYPYVATQIAYKNEKVSPAVTLDLCDCNRVPANVDSYKNQHVLVKVTAEDLGGKILWVLVMGVRRNSKSFYRKDFY
ncbi:MAG: hypothetical protein QXU32_12265 [Nitrososphaerales archaeon]